MKTYLAIILTIIAQTITSAQLISSFAGGDDLFIGPGTAGYSFTVGAEPLTVYGLGVWATSGEGLASSHTIGIWNESSQSLLTSTTVPATGATEINGFWYVSIDPLALQANTTYRIGAQYADIDFDAARGNATSLTMTGASYGHAYLSSGLGFEFPDVDVSGADRGFFGPNAALAPVPEPALLGVVTAAGLAALAAIRRWKARQAAGAGAA